MPIVSIQQLQQAQLDYLIIGGGTSGLTLATRLSENHNVTVGVLEAGGNHLDADEVNIPGNLGSTIANPKFDWTFFSTPQQHAASEPILLPRGKGLGGSSAINFMGIYRPSKDEVDALEKLGNPGWNWEEMLPYFKKSETAVPGIYPDDVAARFGVQPLDPKWHGTIGPIKKSLPIELTEIHGLFNDTVQALGIPMNPDMADGSNTGIINTVCSIDPATAKRSYAATEYFAPNASRPNLLVVIDAHVHKVVFSEAPAGLKHATGVEATCDGQIFTISGVKKDIVLSAGSYQTPQILELSGVGNPRILRDRGIATILDLPGVGENLQDHICARAIVEVDEALETFDILGDPKMLEKHIGLYQQKRGLLASTAAPGCVFASAQQLGIKDDLAIWEKLNEGYGLQSTLSDNMTLKCGLEKQYKIQQSWLAADHLSQAEIIEFDACQAVPGANPVPGKRGFSLKITKTPPFGDFVRSHILPDATLIAPGDGLDHRLREYVKKNCGPIYHPVGTAAMLPLKDGGVVDNNLKIYGTDNLRVVDLSVLPMVVATHTQSLAYAIAEKAAVILEQS